MRQWDIFLFPFPEEKLHPVVVVSPDDRCHNSDLKFVNGRIGTSVRLNRPAKLNEVLPDEADGLEWTTAVRCNFLHVLPKSGLLECRLNAGTYAARARDRASAVRTDLPLTTGIILLAFGHHEVRAALELSAGSADLG